MSDSFERVGVVTPAQMWRGVYPKMRMHIYDSWGHPSKASIDATNAKLVKHQLYRLCGTLNLPIIADEAVRRTVPNVFNNPSIHEDFPFENHFLTGLVSCPYSSIGDEGGQGVWLVTV